MTTIARVLPRSSTRNAARARPRRIPVENVAIFTLALAFYLTAAAFVVFHIHFLIDDAYARIDNASNVLFTRDPHLAAIGFIWPPLPSFLELPIIAFKPLWPVLVTQGFAGSIEAAAFSAGTLVVINSGLRWAGVGRGLRWILCAIFMLNPMIVTYGVQGMSEAMLVFFFLASLLIFVRWCESGRSALLPLLGIVAGLGCLTRVEMFMVTFALGIGVIVRSIRAKVSIREIETKALLFGLPAILLLMLWLGTMTIIMRNPLYFISGVGSNAQQLAGGGRGVIAHETWSHAAKLIGEHAVLLFPAVLPVLAMLAARLLMKRGRLNGLMLGALGLPIALFDIYLLHAHELVAAMRYQIFVIPYTFVVAIYLLHGIKGRGLAISRSGALLMVAVLGASNVATAMVLADPSIAFQEAPLMSAVATGQTIEQVTARTPNIYVSYGGAAYGAAILKGVLQLDQDHGLIACDSLDCFPIVLNAPNPEMFVVSSDRDFEGALAQPTVYHVEYFLVPQGAVGGPDRLNIVYPGLYSSGGGFSKLVGTITAGSIGGPSWRLFRIIGPTGRG